MQTVKAAATGMCETQLNRVREHIKTNYIDAGKISGASTLVARNDKVCFFDCQGQADIENQRPMSEDTIVRLYSMTKPITSIALMMLYEQAKISLNDPVHRYIPEFKKLRVYESGTYPVFNARPARTTMTIKHLLTHTSGLTYEFIRASNVDHAYRKLKIAYYTPGITDTNEDLIQKLAKLPLESNPGERWNYSVSTDVIGRIIEIVSGMSLRDYLKKYIFTPLNMTDTDFEVPDHKLDRFATCYERNSKKELSIQDNPASSSFRKLPFHSGGGGLVSTMADYYQFCRMLLNEGTLNGHRIISPRTLRYMTRNHLPNNADLASMASGIFTGPNYQGIGFGLGFACTLDCTANSRIGSEGEIFWGGAASTLFWVDPKEKLIVIFLTQLMPNGTFDFEGQLHSLIYPAIVD